MKTEGFSLEIFTVISLACTHHPTLHQERIYSVVLQGFTFHKIKNHVEMGWES